MLSFIRLLEFEQVSCDLSRVLTLCSLLWYNNNALNEASVAINTVLQVMCHTFFA